VNSWQAHDQAAARGRPRGRALLDEGAAALSADVTQAPYQQAV
jgi:hypothetical protein